MKSLIVLVILLSFSLTMAGCSSMPSGAVPIGDISNLPQTMLSGAKLDHARSVAMGTARTKGWTIKSAEPNRLLLVRDLPATSPQTAALGSTAATPQIEVETDLVERSDGTIVALKAFIVSNPGTADEKRTDYTTEYENQLLISLSSLQSAWIDSRSKIASTIPVPSQEDVAQQTESQDAPTAAAPTAEPVVVSAPETPPPPVYTQTPDPLPAAAPVEPTPTQQPVAVTTTQVDPPIGTETASVATAGTIAEVPSALPAASAEGLPSSATPALAPAPEPAPRNNMLVLNDSGRKGLWAYYAEDYARLRGCAIDDRGATLLQDTPNFELHEVACAGAANMLVKCQGGVCEGVR